MMTTDIASLTTAELTALMVECQLIRPGTEVHASKFSRMTHQNVAQYCIVLDTFDEKTEAPLFIAMCVKVTRSAWEDGRLVAFSLAYIKN